MKSSKKLFVVGALVIALLAGTYFLMIAPANRRRDALQADSQQKLAAIARNNELATASASMGVKNVAVRNTIARLVSRMPTSRQMNNVAEAIWRLAETDSLQPRTLKTSPGKRSGIFDAQEIDFTVAGRYSNFCQFTRDLEQMPSAVRVEKINVNRIAGRDGDMQVELTLSVPLQPEPKADSEAVANVALDPK